jgi:hypothetical protein
MPRSLHSVGNVENLTLTGAAAIDGTGSAKATVINGTGNILSGFAGINTLIGGGNLGATRHIRGTYSAWMQMCSRCG